MIFSFIATKKPSFRTMQNEGSVLFATKATPGYARGEGKLLARGEVDKKKAP